MGTCHGKRSLRAAVWGWAAMTTAHLPNATWKTRQEGRFDSGTVAGVRSTGTAGALQHMVLRLGLDLVLCHTHNRSHLQKKKQHWWHLQKPVAHNWAALGAGNNKVCVQHCWSYLVPVRYFWYGWPVIQWTFVAAVAAAVSGPTAAAQKQQQTRLKS